MSNNARTRDRLPYNFVDGLKVKGIAVLCVPLWIFAKVRCNGEVAELPSMLMFGGTNKYL